MTFIPNTINAYGLHVQDRVNVYDGIDAKGFYQRITGERFTLESKYAYDLGDLGPKVRAYILERTISFKEPIIGWEKDEQGYYPVTLNNCVAVAGEFIVVSPQTDTYTVMQTPTLMDGDGEVTFRENLTYQTLNDALEIVADNRWQQIKTKIEKVRDALERREPVLQ